MPMTARDRGVCTGVCG